MKRMLLILFVIGILASAQAAMANDIHQVNVQEPAPCSNLQVLFLVDQSGSMSLNHHDDLEGPLLPPNDPQNLRFAGPKTALDLIIDQHLRVYPTSKILVSMAHFGDRPEIGMSWTPITSTTSLEADALRQKFDPYFDPSAVPSLGNTNMLRAFQFVSSMFDSVPAPVGNCPIRIIVLFTDGKPSVLPIDEHMEQIKEYVDRYLPIPPHQLYVIAMNDPDNQGNYWEEMEPYWLTITGDADHIGLVENQSDIGRRFRQIVDEIMAPFPDQTQFVTETLCPGEAVIPPYLQWVSFTLFKSDSRSDHLQIVDEKGILDQSRKDVKVSVIGFNSAIETVQIDNPQPGRWKINTTLPHALCDLEKREIKAVGKMSLPSEQIPVQFTDVEIAFQIVDTQGNPLPDYEDSIFDLFVQAQVVGGDGQDSLDVVEGENHLYSGTMIPTEAGQYKLMAAASSQDIDRNSVSVFEETEMGVFTVASPKLILPAGLLDSPIPLYQKKPITLTIAGPDGEPVSLSYPTVISAQFGLDGGPLSQLEFIQSPQGDYTASLTPVAVGPHQLIYQAVVTLQDNDQHIFGTNKVDFEVSSIEFVDNLSGEAQRQYSQIPITLTVKDQKGNPVNIDLPVVIEAQANVEGSSDVTPLSFSLSPQGSYVTNWKMEKSGRHKLSYRAVITLPDGSRHILGMYEKSFDVTPVTLVDVVWIDPEIETYIATDFLGRPVNLTTEFQLVGEDEQSPISPDMVFLGDAQTQFKVIVTDVDGKDVSHLFRLKRTAKTGRYQIIGEEIGSGEYTLIVQPASPLREDFTWRQTDWSRELGGKMNPVFYALITILVLAAVIFVLCIVAFIRLRKHPAVGIVYVYELAFDGNEDNKEYKRLIFRCPLGGRNRYVYTRGIYWLWPCPIPRLKWDSMPKLIRRIEIGCKSDREHQNGVVAVKAWTTRQKGRVPSCEVQIGPGETGRPLVESYYVEKDPKD